MVRLCSCRPGSSTSWVPRARNSYWRAPLGPRTTQHVPFWQHKLQGSMTLRLWQRAVIQNKEAVTTEVKLVEDLDAGPGVETHITELCDSGLPDTEMCAIDAGEIKPPAQYSVIEEAVTRGRWLAGLLILQSLSSFVLDAYQPLLRDHIVVTLFLTMLVGAGGNAGNQSAIKVIRGLATGTIKPTLPAIEKTLREQATVGLLLGSCLSLAGFVRVYATNGSFNDAFAISTSLFFIVMTSVVLGSGLPFGLTRLGVDPANAGTSIQVVMDILGVFITCVTCNMLLVQYAEGLKLTS